MGVRREVGTDRARETNSSATFPPDLLQSSSDNQPPLYPLVKSLIIRAVFDKQPAGQMTENK